MLVLRTILDRALRLYRLEAENRELQKLSRVASPIDGIIGASQEMMRMCRTIEKIAPTNVAVLALGRAVGLVQCRERSLLLAAGEGCTQEQQAQREAPGHVTS